MSISEIVNNLENELATDPGTNYKVLLESYSTITRVMSLVLGILVVLIWIMFPVIVILEISFITIPLFQSGVYGLVDKFKSKGFSSFIQITFRDAMKAIEASETGQTQLPPAGYYLIHKVKSAMFAAFVIALIVGNGTRIVELISTFMSGILRLDILGITK